MAQSDAIAVEGITAALFFIDTQTIPVGSAIRNDDLVAFFICEGVETSVEPTLLLTKAKLAD